MKKLMIAVITWLTVCLGFQSIPYAEMAKEGKAEYRAAVVTSNIKVLPIAEELMYIDFEGHGMVIDAPPNCPLHKASIHYIAMALHEKGVTNNTIFIIWTRPNGEKIYGYEKSTRSGEKHQGKVTLSGGTGSCNGITGTIETSSMGEYLPAAMGTRQHIIAAKVQWRIP